MDKQSFKKELRFTIIWLCTYFGLLISANFLSQAINIPNSFNAIIEVIFPILVIYYLKKKNLLNYYGLNSLNNLNHKNLIYYLPMVVLILSNLIYGISVNYPTGQIALIAISMIGVGFSEEILFRSFLIRTLEKLDKKLAIILPSALFGLFHLFNLFAGAELFATLSQVLYASFVALAFSLFFSKTNNVVPCMITHALVNITDIFIPTDLTTTKQITMCIVMIVASGLYALYLFKTKKELTRY